MTRAWVRSHNVGREYVNQASNSIHPIVIASSSVLVGSSKGLNPSEENPLGSPVASATFCGLAVGVARGGASLARHAVYKVLWTVGGSDADILEVFDYAIHVGVDVLSFSIGTNRPLYSYVDEGDSIAIGTFHAMARAITVVCAGGNTRPPPQTVVNTALWILTVAASTIDRAFPTAITFGNNSTFLAIKFLENLNLLFENIFFIRAF
ncbi:hypothetical protein AMTR_s00122p00031330 [Amborella trichopoda]|uniref:Peptidase S8/S53 domain-containing protein n=1 Tax=Amborella trichopoda TaxID=13333 RepID=W1NN67_AMBTC|nr:hypothetical protein AMTR_s00122p00031330 [Amborella trichopoda]